LLVYHFDLYRVEAPEQVFDLGYEEFFGGDGICLVEWADRITPLLPPRRFDVRLRHGAGADERVIEILRCPAHAEAV
jgi:tRNA threonylcarbamoyladenosine biosynthesis protein TsaE